MIPSNHARNWFALSSVCVILVKVFSLPETSNPEATIAEVIKQTLGDKSTEDVTRMMKDHLIQMKLMNTNNVWANYRLFNISQKLLPENLDGHDLAEFVNEMAEHAANNPYLHNFLIEASGMNLDHLARLVQKEGGDILPDVVAFAKVLDQLTISMEEDWRVLEACHNLWKKEFTLENIQKYGGFEWFVKAISVQKPIEFMIEAMKTKKTDPNFLRYELPLNILEAKAIDVKSGYLGNAKTAWILAKYSKGGSKNLPTREFTAAFSEDGKSLEYHLPLNKEWADLYQTWNLCFVSSFHTFPYAMAKLLIPSVSNYQEAPKEYIFSRSFALYSTLNWYFLGMMQGKDNKWKMNWASHAVTKAWGDQNAKSSQDYEAKVTKLVQVQSRSMFSFRGVLDAANWFVGAVVAITKWF